MYTKSPCIKYTVGTATCTIPVFTTKNEAEGINHPKGILNITVGNNTYYSPLVCYGEFLHNNLKINGGYPFAEDPVLLINYRACTVKIIGGCGVVSNTTYYSNIYAYLRTISGHPVLLRCDVCLYFYNGNASTCTYVGKITAGCYGVAISNQTVPYNASNKVRFFSTTSPSAWRSVSLCAKQPTNTGTGTHCCQINCSDWTGFDSYMWK